MTRDEALEKLRVEPLTLHYEKKNLWRNTFCIVMLTLILLACAMGLTVIRETETKNMVIVFMFFAGGLLYLMIHNRILWYDTFTLNDQGIRRENPKRGEKMILWKDMAPPKRNLAKDEIHIRSMHNTDLFRLDIALFQFSKAEEYINAILGVEE